jgi:hypothetical protein
MEKLKEIERLAFLKYRLSGKKSMNTFIFTQSRLHKLTDKEIDTLLYNLEKKIKKYNEKESQAIKFTCNI